MTEHTIEVHARLSPSGAARWTACTAAPGAEDGIADSDSDSSREGTAAHEAAAWRLTGEVVKPVASNGVDVTTEMMEHVDKYVAAIKAIVDSTGGTLLVEQKLSIEHITGEVGAKGTSDAVIIAGTELIVADLKFGANPNNRVDAEDNLQLAMYAGGALEELSLSNDFKTVRMMIFQPRLDHVSEWVVSVDKLTNILRWIASRAEKSRLAPEFSPGEKACQWCKAKATCLALAEYVADKIGAQFDDVSEQVPARIAKLEKIADGTLGVKMAATKLIESWITAVRAEVERRLLAGTPVPGYKLVEGRAGARAWTDAAAAEEMLRKQFRIPVEKAYDLSLISPTAAEKLFKAGDIGKKQWPKLQPLIGRSAPKPSVAPESDKREAMSVVPIADTFDDVSAAVEESLV